MKKVSEIIEQVAQLKGEDLTTDEKLTLVIAFLDGFIEGVQELVGEEQ